jgi:hypothetical protein
VAHTVRPAEPGRTILPIRCGTIPRGTDERETRRPSGTVGPMWEPSPRGGSIKFRGILAAARMAEKYTLPLGRALRERVSLLVRPPTCQGSFPVGSLLVRVDVPPDQALQLTSRSAFQMPSATSEVPPYISVLAYSHGETSYPHPTYQGSRLASSPRQELRCGHGPHS